MLCSPSQQLQLLYRLTSWFSLLTVSAALLSVFFIVVDFMSLGWLLVWLSLPHSAAGCMVESLSIYTPTRQHSKNKYLMGHSALISCTVMGRYLCGAFFTLVLTARVQCATVASTSRLFPFLLRYYDRGASPVTRSLLAVQVETCFASHLTAHTETTPVILNTHSRTHVSKSTATTHSLLPPSVSQSHRAVAVQGLCACLALRRSLAEIPPRA